MEDMNAVNKTSEYAQHYLIYARKSTDDADSQKNSIAYQVGECLRYAKKNSLVLADFTLDGFSDKGIIREKHTAYSTPDLQMSKDGLVQYRIERPKFQKLVELLIRGDFHNVLCLCWDRISRNDQDAGIIKKLIGKGTNIVSVQAKYEKSSSGALHMDIDSVFASHYSRVISEKVRAANEKLRGEGRCLYVSPIGYLDKGSDNKVLDPERAPLVRRISEMYATGDWSLSQLAKWANGHGLTTKPSRRNRTQKEKLAGIELEDLPKVPRPVNRKTIENTLKNPFYIGKLRDASDRGRVIDGRHQPLIDISLFNKVQAVLKSRRLSVHYVDKGFFTYRGLVRCTCGRIYTPYMKKGIIYYSCRCKDGCDNQKRNVREDLIDQTVEQVLGQIHFTKEELKEIEAGMQSGLDKVSQERNRQLDDLHTQRKRAYADLSYLTTNKIALLRTNAITMDEYHQDVATLEQEIAEVDEQTEAYRLAEGEMIDYVVSFSELVRMAKVYYRKALDVEKRGIASQVFSELYLHNGELANLKAKQSVAALFKRHGVKSGGPDYLFSELYGIYLCAKDSLEGLKRLSFLPTPKPAEIPA